MPTHQETITFQTSGRALREITTEVGDVVRRSGLRTGIASVFCLHTSASLVTMENADPSAQRDLEAYFARLAPDGDPRYEHESEGPDDMSAHLRMALTRSGETVPFSNGRLILGTWQGLFLWEHRTAPHRRGVVVTVAGD